MCSSAVQFITIILLLKQSRLSVRCVNSVAGVQQAFARTERRVFVAITVRGKRRTAAAFVIAPGCYIYITARVRMASFSGIVRRITMHTAPKSFWKSVGEEHITYRTFNGFHLAAHNAKAYYTLYYIPLCYIIVVFA